MPSLFKSSRPAKKRRMTKEPQRRKRLASRPMLRGEIKEYQNQTNQNTVNQNGELVELTSVIAQGTEAYQRVGRHIKILGAYLDILLTGPTATNYADWGMVYLVHDKQPNNSAPTFGTIFDIVSANPGQAFLNTLQYRERFTVLMQKPIYVQATTVGATVGSGNIQPDAHMRLYVKVPRFLQDCEFLSSAAATPSTGALYVCFGSRNNSVTTTENFSFSLNTKLFYTDV